MKFKLNRRAMRALRNSAEVVAHLEERAHAIASAAGPGNEVLPAEKGTYRARVAVVTASFPAIYAEATSRALTRALGSGAR
jgi:hypothetical protein